MIFCEQILLKFKICFVELYWIFRLSKRAVIEWVNSFLSSYFVSSSLGTLLNTTIIIFWDYYDKISVHELLSTMYTN